MIIERKTPWMQPFGDVAIGTVFGDLCEGNISSTYLKMQPVIMSRGGQADTICNAVDIETGEQAFFGNEENVIPFVNAKVILE